MKVIIILVMAIAPSLFAKIEFVGVFYLGKDGNFSLRDSESGQTSGWLQQGQAFRGYRLESYDRKQEVLSLVSSDDRLKLRLRPSVVKADRVTIRGDLTIGAARELAINDALLVVGEEAKFQSNERTWMTLKSGSR